MYDATHALLPRTILINLLCVVFYSCSMMAQEKAGEQQPNVVLIMADDQGYGDLSIHGNSWIETPVLDQLAASGTRLDRFYVSPLCAPTRASLLTGRYHTRTGVIGVSRGLENMRTEEFTLAELFQGAGYATGIFGKWHNGAYWPYHPNAQGFEEFIGFAAGHWNNYFDTELEHNGDPYPTQGYITDVITRDAMRFIENNKEQPFFCYIPYNVPHSPFQVPDAYFDKYYALLSDITEEEDRRKRASVYGMVEHMDQNIGSLLQKLDELELSENTIVIFLSDNGPNGHRYNAKMRGVKGTVHEGGVRVPFFLRWPGHIPSGRMLQDVTAHIDVLPTLASLCNIPLPESVQVDGMDLSPLLTGHMEKLPPRTVFVHQSAQELSPLRGGVRNENYRLTLEEEEEGLYDMQLDPSQLHNLASEMPEHFDSLKRMYYHWYQELAENYQENTSIPVGYEDFPRVFLPAHESSFQGNIHFREGHGWAHDWLVNWRSSQDAVWWNVEVVEAGSYQISLVYTCPAADTGSVVTLEAAEQQLKAQVSRAFDPEYMHSPDRIPRQEVYEKKWASLQMGKLQLEAGSHQFRLQAEEVAGSQVMELKGVLVQRVPLVPN